MIVASDIELRAGARLLIEGASFRVNPGDKIGLVGRNGAGKTTLTRVLAGEGQPAAGTVTVSGEVGYLPQDPRTGDLRRARPRPHPVAPAGWTRCCASCARPSCGMASADDRDQRDGRCARYGAAGGPSSPRWAATPPSREAASIASSLGLPDRVLDQPLETLSGGQRRRVELARILFCGRRDAAARRADQPPGRRLDRVAARFPDESHQGGLIIISHDVDAARATVNQVFHLDANRAVLDIYNVGWKAYLQQRGDRRAARASGSAPTPRRRPPPCMAQADKMRRQGHQGQGRAEHGRAAPSGCWPGLEDERAQRPGRQAALPGAGAVRAHAAHGRRACRSRYGSLEVFTDVDLAIDRGSRVVVLGLNGAGKTTLLRILAGRRAARHRGRSSPATGCGSATTRRSTRRSTPTARVLENMRSAAPELADTEVRKVLGSFLFTGDDVRQAGRGALGRGEDPAGAGHAGACPAANVLLLDEPTNNLDPASREEVLVRCAPMPGRSCWSPTTRAP